MLEIQDKRMAEKRGEGKDPDLLVKRPALKFTAWYETGFL